MMNIGIIFYAAQQSGNDELFRKVMEHCLTTRRYLVRGDGSTAHEGIFDLEGCTVAKPLVFLECLFDSKGDPGGALRLRDSRLKRIALYACQVKGAIKADRANIESAFFMTGSTVAGMVRLRGVTIGEALAMDGVRVDNPRDTAILADGLRLGGPWVLRAAAVNGQTRFAGARIGGRLVEASSARRTSSSAASRSSRSERITAM